MKQFKILEIDPYLAPYESDINLRMENYASMRKTLLGSGKSLKTIAKEHTYYGFHTVKGGWVYREWAPAAEEITLFGDFNGWNREEHKLTKLNDEDFEISFSGKIPHGSKVRIRIRANGREFERIPLYAKRLVQDEHTKAFDAVIWSTKKYSWKTEAFVPNKHLFIYECHIGMSSEEERVATFSEFTQHILPRIHQLGYTAVQIMAVMEHPYYGSFGYQVTNLFAVSSRFGTPEEFKELVDTAHGLGIAVIMDIVHSHIAPNTEEGLAEFDGTDYQFCHSGGRGSHPAWGTRLYDYNKPKVLKFLLSNVNYWLTEYKLDGFRFDGITSMLYHHHGLGVAFSDYSHYFSTSTDTEAVTYLQLAAEVCREINKHSILIAEDMSGMPGMCLPITDGGIGFHYRLNMGLPDYLIKMMKMREEDWHLGTLWHELVSRRPKEKTIGYTESHDQALVGDKTLMFWMADQEMYWHMHKDDNNPTVERAMALHKMFRLITCACGGEGYLNFMGNEFGHPEWVDFPRQGNGWSCYHARRQWSLADNPDLKYQYLLAFDKAMLKLCAQSEEAAVFVMVHEDNKVLVFEKGKYTFVFNFHGWNSFVYDCKGDFEIVLHTAWKSFGGYVDETINEGLIRPDGVVADRRTAIVLERKNK